MFLQMLVFELYQLFLIKRYFQVKFEYNNARIFWLDDLQTLLL